VKIIYAILLTLAALFLTFINSVEAPPFVGENYAVLFVGLLNLLWLIPYSCFYIYKKDYTGLKRSIALYSIFFCPFVVKRFYNTPFNSEKWKAQINTNRHYDIYPAHANGDMVQYIIESKVLIGLSIEEIENKLGKNYYSDQWVDDFTEGKTRLFYFYSGGVLFDGCDKLMVIMKNNKCIETSFGGCD
jgi:hypothetical protein